MSISNSTALAIANRDDLIYSYAGPDESGKYSGWISYPNGRPLLNTKHLFESAKIAEAHMINLRADLISHFRNIQTESIKP